MPFVYALQSVQLATNFTTSGTANTEVDHCFIKPGTRNIALISLLVGGKAAGLTAISGIAFRIKKWTTTAASGGTAAVPTPRDPGMQAAKATAGMSASAGVTAGTGGPTFLGGCLCGAAGPGGWVAPNPDAAHTLEGSATQSLDIFSVSGTVSLNFDITNLEFQE